MEGIEAIHGRGTPEARSELKIPADLAPVAVLCLGYPAEVPEAIECGRPPTV